MASGRIGEVVVWYYGACCGCLTHFAVVLNNVHFRKYVRLNEPIVRREFKPHLNFDILIPIVNPDTHNDPNWHFSLL